MIGIIDRIVQVMRVADGKMLSESVTYANNFTSRDALCSTSAAVMDIDGNIVIFEWSVRITALMLWTTKLSLLKPTSLSLLGGTVQNRRPRTVSRFLASKDSQITRLSILNLFQS